MYANDLTSSALAPARAAASPEAAGARRKIWEISGYQCSILGTCLGMKDLHRVARKVGLVLAPRSPDYEVHGRFVGLCQESGPVARLIQKELDRRYRPALRLFARAEDAAQIAALWQKALDDGDIPGPYWAVLSHPGTSLALRARVFGEVHMLSHLVGASNRADIRRLRESEERAERLSEQLVAVREAWRRRVDQEARGREELAGQLAALGEENRRLREAAREVQGQTPAAEVARLEDRLREQASTEHALRQDCARQGRLLAAYAERIQRLEEDLGESREDARLLGEELSRLSGPCAASCPDSGTPRCPGRALCGRRILYVGGRTNLVRHYRAMVERLGGEFLHHDGGLEDGSRRLPQVVGCADAVFCPADCVSHEACQCVKRLCKSSCKPFVVLRSAGLAALSRSLAGLEAGPGCPGEGAEAGTGPICG